MNKSLAILLLSIICAVAMPAHAAKKYTDDRDVLVAQNRGELQTLYDELQAKKAKFKPTSKKGRNAAEFLVKVGEKIADEKEAIILNDLQRDLDARTITELEEAKERASDIKSYSEPVYVGLIIQLDTKISEKNAFVSQKNAEFQRLDDNHAAAKVALLDEIRAVSGGEKGAAVLASKQAYIDGLFQSAQEHMASKRYEDVLRYLDQLDTVSQNYSGAKDLRYQLLAAEYQQQFWDALGKGDSEQSFVVLKKLTQIPNYLNDNPDVKAVAEELATVLRDDGDTAMKSLSVAGAYDAYSKARFIDIALGAKRDPSESEVKFVEYVNTRLVQYFEAKDYVPAYGYLSILAEMEPYHKSIEEYGQTINNVMLDYASLKLVPSYLTDTRGNRELSREIIRQVSRQLPKLTQSRVNFVDRALTSAAYTAAKVSAMVNPEAFYFLTGEILDASIKASEKETVTPKNVLVSYQTVENPEYIAWTQLKKRQRKKTPEPVTTVQQAVNQDINISTTEVSKSANLSVTYRLAKASGKVVLADALNENIKVEDTGTAALEIGLFKQEAEPVEIASDEQLYSQLADATAINIVSAFAKRLDEYESYYLIGAKVAAEAGENNQALASFAFSNILMQSRNTVNEDTLAKVRYHAIRWK